jgi:diguanylate cyclase
MAKFAIAMLRRRTDALDSPLRASASQPACCRALPKFSGAAMNEPKTPDQIARETLKRLIRGHISPTPANYQAIYHEVAGLPNAVPFPEQPLRQIAHELASRDPQRMRQLAHLDQAIGRHSWQGVQESLLAFIADAANGGLTLPAELALLLTHFITSVRPALGDENSQINVLFAELLVALRETPVNEAKLRSLLLEGQPQILFAAEEQGEIKVALTKLLHLIIENIGQLSLDDSWLKGQAEGLRRAIEPPLTLRHLDEMERRLRDVMVKQGEAKHRSLEAQEEMRKMLAAFVERLAAMNASSASFQGKIEQSARQITGVKRIEELAPLLDEVVATTRGMVEETAMSRQELQGLQDKVRATEARLVQLHLELDNASALARHDPLTDALNRKGLDEALAREIAGMRRKDTPLSLCLLDVDNFKMLNDRLGHDIGDGALVHLVKVARANMRPSDSLARYGGEEFVILMPDTVLYDGIEAMSRLQRDLTRTFFLAGREKILITFSAGVVQLQAEESGVDAIRRADRAMYLAKRSGKNRVMGG